MSEKLKKKSVLTPRNVREKSNTVIYDKTPTLTIKRREIKKWDINRAVRAVYSKVLKKMISLPTFQHLVGLGQDWGINKILVQFRNFL
jgi:hypothetical protein